MEEMMKEPKENLETISKEELDGIFEEKANALLNEKAVYRSEFLFATSYASRRKIIFEALTQKCENFIPIIIDRLKKENITKDEADILMDAESSGIRYFAIDLASKSSVIEKAIDEYDECVVLKILGRLKKEKITKKEASILAKSKNSLISDIFKEVCKKFER